MNTAPQPPPNHRWRSGDLFVHPATADQDVEWLILSAGSGGSDLLVVAADTEPLAGVGDLALPHDSPLAPLVIRCSASCRLDPSALDAAVPTGHLEEPWPHAALELADGVEHGAVRGTPLEREAEDDSELSHRRQVLDEARRRLSATAAHDRDPEVVTGPWRSAPAPTSTKPSPTTLWQAAAGILLATCLGLAWLSMDLARDRGTARAAPRVLPVEELINLDPSRSRRASVTASNGFWRLHLLVNAYQAPDGFVVQISEPLGSATDPLEVFVGPELLPQMMVEIPDDALVPGVHRVELVDSRNGEVLDELVVTFREAPSPPSASPPE